MYIFALCVGSLCQVGFPSRGGVGGLADERNRDGTYMVQAVSYMISWTRQRFLPAITGKRRKSKSIVPEASPSCKGRDKKAVINHTSSSKRTLKRTNEFCSSRAFPVKRISDEMTAVVSLDGESK